MKIVFIIIESLLISLALTSTINKYYFENGKEQSIFLEENITYYFFVEGVSQNQLVQMTIKTSDNKIPFKSVNNNNNIYIGAAIFEYDKNNVTNSKGYYYKLNVSNENNYYKLYTSENVYYYNTTIVSFNLTANYSE